MTQPRPGIKTPKLMVDPKVPPTLMVDPKPKIGSQANHYVTSKLNSIKPVK
jgi:hypothetical protein